MSYESPIDLWNRFEELADRFPDSLAVSDRDGNQFSYGELARQTGEFALDSFSCPSAVVALRISDPFEQIVGIFASLRADQPYWVVPEHLSDEETAHYLDALQPSPGAAVAYLTSGSTGKSRLIRRTASQILTRYEVYADECHFAARDRFALLGHPGFVAVESELYGALLTGGSLHLVDASNRSASEFSSWVRDEEITVLHPPVPFFESWRKSWSSEDRFPSIRCLLLGGGGLSAQSLSGVWDHFKKDAMIHHRYSSTETGPVARNIICRDDDFAEGSKIPLGIPYPFIEWKLRDRSGDDGELLVKTPEISPDAKLDPEGYFHTRDWISIFRSGEWGFLGRDDGIVKIRGFRVHSSRITDALLALPGVALASTIVNGEDALTRRLIGFVELEPSSTLSSGAIQSELEKLLAPWARPHQIIVLPSIPKTANGKIDSQRLRQYSEETAPTSGSFDDEADQLKALWISSSRWIGDIDPEVDLTDQGGDSIVIISFLDAVEKSVGIELSQSDFVENSTIAELAQLLSARKKDEGGPPVSSKLLNRTGFPPMVCLPVSGDPTLRYWEFAKELDGIFSVHVIMPYGLTGSHRPHRSIADQVTYYSGLIEEKFPGEAVTLCGLSIGGITAYAIASQGTLEIRHLVLLDPQLTSIERRHRRTSSQPSQISRALSFLTRHRGDLRRALRDHRYQIRNELRYGTLARLHQARDVLKHRVGFSLKGHRNLFLARCWWLFHQKDNSQTFPINLREAYFLHLNLKARNCFDPSSYDGSVHFVATNGFFNEGAELRSKPWKKLCANLKVSFVDTDHMRICAPPFVKETARLVSEFTPK